MTLLKKCVDTTEYYYDKLVREIENIVDEDRITTHQDITRTMENYLEKTKVTIWKNFNILDRFYDYSYSPII